MAKIDRKFLEQLGAAKQYMKRRFAQCVVSLCEKGEHVLHGLANKYRPAPENSIIHPDGFELGRNALVRMSDLIVQLNHQTSEERRKNFRHQIAGLFIETQKEAQVYTALKANGDKFSSNEMTATAIYQTAGNYALHNKHLFTDQNQLFEVCWEKLMYLGYRPTTNASLRKFRRYVLETLIESCAGADVDSKIDLLPDLLNHGYPQDPDLEEKLHDIWRESVNSLPLRERHILLGEAFIRSIKFRATVMAMRSELKPRVVAGSDHQQG